MFKYSFYFRNSQNLLAIGIILFFICLSSPIFAKTFVVNSNRDAIDANVTDTVCETALGDCTLRAAVQQANAWPGLDTIQLEGQTYLLSLPGVDEDVGVSGDLDITDDLIIVGINRTNTLIDGAQIDRVFHVLQASLSISHMTVANGQIINGVGGCVNVTNSGTATTRMLEVNLTDVILNNCSATTGGAIKFSGFRDSALRLENVEVAGSTATSSGGGGLSGSGGSITVVNSAFNNNRAEFGGGAMEISSSAGTLGFLLENSTLRNNIAGFQGGGLSISASSTAEHSTANNIFVLNNTIASNTAGFGVNSSTAKGGGMEIRGYGLFYIHGNEISNNSVMADMGSGGGISLDVSGSGQQLVYLDHLLVSGNTAPSSGGGIGAVNLQSISHSTITLNTAGNRGGGVYLSNLRNSLLDNHTLIENTLIHDNRVDNTSTDTTSSVGGGIYHGNGSLTLVNSTVVNNRISSSATGTASGGGLYLRSSGSNKISLKHVTLFSNSSPDAGGNLSGPVTGDLFTVENSIIAGALNGGNCNTMMVNPSVGYNVVDDSSCGFNATGDITVSTAQPLLGNFGDNGGPTHTMALASQSAAKDLINNTIGNCAVRDQRGFFRTDAACDAGAFEEASASLVGDTLQFVEADIIEVESNPMVTLVVNRIADNNQPIQSPISVRYTTRDITTNGYPATTDVSSLSDYEPQNGVIQWLDGDQTPKSFDIPLQDSLGFELTEQFQVILFDPKGGAQLGVNSVATITIEDDDDSGPSIGFETTNIAIPEDNPSLIVVVENLRGNGIAQIGYRISGGTAQNGQDYMLNDGILEFDNGVLRKGIEISLQGDRVFEGNETIELTIFNDAGIDFGVIRADKNVLTITLEEDYTVDTSVGIFEFADQELTVQETQGSVRIPVGRSNGSFGSVQVSYEVIAGSATLNQDYTLPTVRTVQFGDQAITQFIEVTLEDDMDEENTETFQLILSQAGGGAQIGSKNIVTVNIESDESFPPVVPGVFNFKTINASRTERDTTIELEIIRQQSTVGQAVVAVGILQATATAGTDFSISADPLIFSDGEQSKILVVTILDDNVSEENETIILQLNSGPGNRIQVGLNAQSTITIFDDGDTGIEKPDSGADATASKDGGGGVTWFFLGLLFLAIKRLNHSRVTMHFLSR
ncbi:Calx-beta domain-containing protein [Kaarinaea lacus]